jgi:hypothetical protein
MAAVVDRYLPPPPRDVISPFLWGEDATVRDRLKADFGAVETSILTITWGLQRSAAESAQFFAQNAGPIRLALGRLDPLKQAALLQELERLWIDNNLATNGASHTLISNEYLQALAVRR